MKFKLWRTMIAVALVAIIIGAVKMHRDSQPPHLWERWLMATDPSLREAGAFNLGRIGMQALGAMPALSHALRVDPEPAVRKQAAISIYMIILDHENEQERRDAIIALVGSQQDHDPSVRAASAVGLSALRAGPGLTIQALIRAAEEKGGDQWGRGTALQELARLVPKELAGDREVVDVVLAALVDEDPRVRELAVDAYFILSEKASSILSVALKNHDVRLRRAATQALRRNGLRAGAALPWLLSALNDTDVEVREAAAESLSVAIPDPQKDVPTALIDSLKDQNTAVRRASVNAIGLYKARARGVLPALESLRLDEDEDIRRSADKVIFSIWCAQEDIKMTVAHLTEMLKAKDPSKRSFAVEGLHRMGRDAAPAVADLMRVIQNDPDDGIRESASRAKEEIVRAGR